MKTMKMTKMVTVKSKKMMMKMARKKMKRRIAKREMKRTAKVSKRDLKTQRIHNLNIIKENDYLKHIIINFWEFLNIWLRY